MNVRNHRLLNADNSAVQYINSPNQGGVITPLYLIMHYTAGARADGAISWFKKRESQASAHIVIDRDGTITQMVPFNKTAWHAGRSAWGNLSSLNKYSVGIELVNAGKLRQRADGMWVNWASNVIPSSEVIIAKHKAETEQAGWHEYPQAQLEAAIDVAMALHRTYRFQDVLGHEDVSPGRKVDPGPAFPMSSFRSRVLGRKDDV